MKRTAQVSTAGIRVENGEMLSVDDRLIMEKHAI